ncbi:L-type lectin-domain containing receptor kinase IX.1 [Zea mays]|uniref:L-type lectin-domain containing receptor kinase IX.1 n=1 Tax=Zea mays TaxID=4577 RepID=A0A3L6DD89_MAIZE|nr:L-type lectin-domain containing receptor kinase IX.1 [Zea mays]
MEILSKRIANLHAVVARERRREESGLDGKEEHLVRRGAGPELHPHVPGAPGAGAREREAVQHRPGRARRRVRVRVRAHAPRHQHPAVHRPAGHPPDAVPARAVPGAGRGHDVGARASGGSGWHGYAAPELASGAAARATQESDVYNFGMVLLEVVAGECSDETMGMVKIGICCAPPEERPTMAQVLAMMSEFV